MKKLIFAYLYDRNYIPFKNEDLRKIDIINYAFGKIENGQLSIKHLRNLSLVVKQAHEVQVKVVLAIGGWGADGFSQACSSYETRKTLIDSIIKIIKEYNLQGIDIDWEYPTSKVANIHSSDEDRENFTSLVLELKKEMKRIDASLILSAAVGGGEMATRYYEVDKISQHLDFIHLMTYDLIDYAALITSHHANLYYSPYSYTSADQTVQAYLKKGADVRKLVIGIAFYGHIGEVDENINNGMKVKCNNLTNSISYTNIVNKYLNDPNFINYYDDIAKAAWLYDGQTFITYDDQRSIREKVKYVKSRDLAGIMLWELNHDATCTLINTIFENI